MTERTGEAFELDEHLTVLGDRLKVGDAAPAFLLDLMDASDGAIRGVSLADSAGTTRLLNVINSIDTPVCQVETRSWERSLPVDDGRVRVYTVSMDLPFALDRWRQAEDAGHVLLSAHRDEAFGRDYGVLIKEWRLLQRAVFVIGPDDRLRHVEYVADQMREPDYAAALAALR
ncbi:thiol peroxidase [Streptacidiphilus rugosus]|uniref:thiol peroxidase n=1 Tax=Streptacidiphilus rugosus TaxID=405783 RepID=UPI000566EE50|nr:thiol peroxidase [Streptacidiphilus rugosus]